MTYRPYLSRVTRDNWTAVLVFPILLLLGLGLAGWALFDFLSFMQALGHDAPRLALDPGGVRFLAIGVALILAGLLPLLPVPEAGRRGSSALAGAGGMVLKILVALCALALFFGPAMARPAVESAMAAHRYRQWAPFEHRHTTLRWVKLSGVRPEAACPERWQDACM